MRICKKCGKEFETHGRLLRLCAECRAQENHVHIITVRSQSALISAWTNDLPTNDFRYCAEELHHCGKAYALYCEGGAMSKHCSRTWQDTGYGHHIEPFSVEQAESWMQSHGFSLDLLKKI